MIGLDLGTTNCKAVLLDTDGCVRAVASGGYQLQFPHPGWAEQDVWHVWEAAKKVLRAVAESAPREVPPQGICFSGAMHSLFPVADDTGTPISNAMTWADARAIAVYPSLSANADTHALYRRTGCPVQSTYHLQRLRWWNEVEPEQAQRAYLWVGIKDWILHALTGVWASDLSLASTTGLLNLQALTWDAGALRLAGVLPDQLPSLISPSAVVGGLIEEAAVATGLPVGLPVIAGGSDGAMASLGTGATAPGQMVITVGTSGAVRKVVGEPWFDPGERTWCYLLADAQDGPLWFIGGAINNGGLALQWVREKFYPDLIGTAGFEQLVLDAASVPPGADGVFLLPYFAGERSPHWAPKDKAMLYGLGMQHSRVHIARAAMEGVANCLADVWDVLYDSGTSSGEMVRLTGGITRTPLWAQILADMLGVQLMALEIADASAAGAGLLGMHALGLAPALAPALRFGASASASVSADPLRVAGAVEPGPIYTPDLRRHEFYKQHHREYKALRSSMSAMGEKVDSLKESFL